MRNRIYWNEDWGFAEEFTDSMLKSDYEKGSLHRVRLPHTNKETSFHYFDEHEYQMICGYRKEFEAKEEWKGKRVLLTFEGAAHVAHVYLNGEEIASHYCGYTAFQVDLAPYLKYDSENVLVVKLDSHETLNIPPFGNVIDYMTYGGIYREVYLEIKEMTYVKDVFVTTDNVLSNKKEVKAAMFVAGDVKETTAKLYLREANSEDRRLLCEKTLTKNNEDVIVDVEDVKLWDIENPNLYYLEVELTKDGQIVDQTEVRFGFRKQEFRKDGFYLNEKKVKIVGVNRHQSYAYVGYAMPKGPQQRDADLIKRELGVNAVRTSHYPQSQYFVDRCDEIGLLVFTELPGWQCIGDAEWKNEACNMLEELILQYRNHPSIILWGVRINESPDDDEFYERTNRIAHELDPSRQTGGVRCIKKSNLLEDVYTYNDFVHDGTNHALDTKKNVTSNVEKPYLVSEFNGHMFPTKSFDCEDHRLEHSLRHARVLDSLYKQENISGAFAWCMFDYNTHKEFGSGDRICYHGIMDMFRNQKMAASVYSSQSDMEPVLEISSSMDIGEHQAGCKGDIYIFTNADAVRLYKNGSFIKEYTHKDSTFKHMKRGPIIIDDLIGSHMEEEEGFSHKKAEGVKKILMAASKFGPNHLPLKIKLLAARLVLFHGMKPSDGLTLYSKYVGDWGGNTTTYRFEAIKDGKVVKVVDKKPMTEIKMSVNIDHTELVEDTSYDVACVRIKACDENGNVLNYYQEPITLEATGDIEIIGPKVISLKGGMGGTFVKTKGNTGNGTLHISGDGIQTESFAFTVEKR